LKPERYIAYTDDALMELVKNDDEGAFRVIYDRHSRDVFDAVYNGLHKLEESKEVVQEVFFYLWAKRDTIRINSSLKGYLLVSARHAMLNMIRSDKVRSAYAADLTLFSASLHDNSTIEWQDFQDLEQLIESSLAQLPEKCQTIFKMRWKEHLSSQHIAARLNIAPHTVENNVSIALKHLRGAIGDYLVSLLFFMLSL
jgi:RNA polymerase sigma-70 factor (ECF subfamily)